MGANPGMAGDQAGLQGQAMIAVFVPGHCAVQGSIRYVGKSNAGRAILTSDSKKTKPWRADVRAQLLDDCGKPRAVFASGVHVEAEFVMPRPKSCPKKSTPQAVKKPDLDKLMRALLDAVTSAGVWRDDSQVISVSAIKRLAKLDETPGLHLEIMDAISKENAHEQ